MDKTKNLRESYLDGEALYRKYFEVEGFSYQRLQKYAVLMEMVSPDGNPPTLMGVWKSMWRWASLKENKETAWQIYQHLHPEAKRSEWDLLMLDRIRKAWQYRTEARYTRFLRDNGWL